MNVIQTIDDELKDRHLSDLEKLRYIYIRCCQLFHFDARWYYTYIWDDKLLHDQIASKRFDLENVDDFSVVCHSISRYVLKPLINNFTNLDCKVIGSEHHSFIEITDHNDNLWFLDATNGDLSRVKADIYPTEMENKSLKGNLLLDEIDENLGFNFKTLQDYECLLHGTTYAEIYRMIGYLLSNTDCKYHFADANFFLNFLTIFSSNNSRTYLDRDYNFHKLIELDNGNNFFELSRDEDYYTLKQIDKNKYKYLSKRLRCK